MAQSYYVFYFFYNSYGEREKDQTMIVRYMKLCILHTNMK